MENSFEQHIGTAISVNEKSVTYSAHAFNKHVLPAVNAIANTYNMLGIGVFNQTIFEKLLTQKGVDEIMTEYEESLNIQVSGKMKLSELAQKTAMLNSIPETSAALHRARRAFSEALNEAQQYGNGDCPIHIKADSFRIINGKPILDEIKIKEASTQKIETEEQAKTYEMILRIKASAEALVEVFKSEKVNFPGWEQLIELGYPDKVFIAKDAPFAFDRMMGFKKMQDALNKTHIAEVDKQKQKLQKQWDSSTHDLNGRPYSDDSDPLFNQKLKQPDTAA